MPQDFIVVKEVIASSAGPDTFEVHSAIKTSDDIFRELFKTDYPSSGMKRGTAIAKIPIGDVEFTLVWAQQVEWINNSKVVTSSPMTLGSWTLWKLLSDHGFRMLESRNYFTKRDADNIFNGVHFVERVFVRDV